MAEDIEQTTPLTKNDLVDLRDKIANHEYFKEDRPRSAAILAIFFNKAINANTSTANRVSLTEIMSVYETNGIDENTARHQVTALAKNQLPRFFVTAGKDLPYKALLRKDAHSHGYWFLEFAKNDTGMGDCVVGFWNDYFCSKSETLLLLGESLFFTDGKNNFVRNFYCNERNDRKPLRRFLGSKIEKLKPTYAYMSSGQVKAAFAVLELFQEHHAQARFQECAGGLTESMKRHNLIVLGNLRTNGVFGSIQEHANHRLSVTERGISKDGKPLEDKTRLTPKKIRYRSVLTRCPNFYGNHVITAIASNYGRSAIGVASFLSQQECLAELVKALMVRARSVQIPPRFQVLFEVTVQIEPGETVLNTRIEDVCL